MPTFPDLREFYDPALVLPIGGKEYRVEAPTVKEGMRLRRLMNDKGAATESTDHDYLTAILGLLGATWDSETEEFTGGVWSEMIADGVPWPSALRVAETAGAHYGLNEMMSQAYWGAPAFAAEAQVEAAPQDGADAEAAE